MNRDSSATCEMRGKVAVVTGGGQGIGRAVVRRLAGEGLFVVIADTDGEAGSEAAAMAGNDSALFVQTDVADESGVRTMIERGVGAFGRIDFLVNNAGIAAAHLGPVESLPLEAWSRMIAVNLTGAFLCAKHAAPHLRASSGAIVNIASTRALMSEPDTEAYAASKGGIVALTHALAASLGPEVRVNCISPGWIDVRGWRKGGTGGVEPLAREHHAQHPAGRVGRPEDIASMVFHLLSPEQGFLTGQNIVVDGGMTRKMIYR